MPKWFATRQITALTLNIISIKDFNERIAIPNMKLHHYVVDFIRTGAGPIDYRVRVMHGKKRFHNNGLTVSDIDYACEDLKQYDGLLEALPRIFWRMNI